MSTTRIGSAILTADTPTSKVRVGSAPLTAASGGVSKVRVGSAPLSASGLSAVRVGSATLKSQAASTATWYFQTGGQLVALSWDQTPWSNPFPPYGPYGPLGSYKPVAATAGCKDESILTPLVGNQTITTGGTAGAPLIIKDKLITGILDVRANYVTIQNCKIVGSLTRPTSDTGLVRFEIPGVHDNIIEDCTLIPDQPDQWIDGIRGHHFIARRNDISGVVDGFGLVNTASPATPQSVHLEANYVHDFAFRVSSSQSDGHTHNDGVQLRGGSDIWISWNNFQGFTNPAYGDIPNPYASSGNQITGQVILSQPTSGAVSGVHILDNWMDGGGEAGIVHATDIGAGQTNLEVKRNKAGHNQRTIGGVKYTVRMTTGLTGTDVPLTGVDANVFEDTGLPVNVVVYAP